jgi:gliding motility-associated-like protein
MRFRTQKQAMRGFSTFQGKVFFCSALRGARFLLISGLLGVLFFVGPGAVQAQCPTVLAIMVDACGTEQLNEFVIINSGGGFNTSELQFSFDAGNNTFSGTPGTSNNDIHINLGNPPGDPTPCSLQPGNASLIGGCSNVISVGLNFNIPPNSMVVLQTSAGADVPYDFSAVCGSGGCIYVIQNACTRLIGGFTNQATGSPGPRSNVLALNNGLGCFFTYIYNTTLLSNGANGDYFMPPAGFGNAGCVAPPVPAPAPPVTPTLTPQGPFCSNASPVNLPTTQSGITGTWSGPGVTGGTVFNPAVAGNGTHTLTFTPDPSQCANPNTIMVTVNSAVTPTFTQLGPYCQNATPAALPTTSTNTISGTWNPATINTATPGTTTYTFTPSAGQCATPTTMMVTVNASTTTTFTQIGPLCQFSAPFALPTTSSNGITGMWAPVTVFTSLIGDFTYNFTPTPGQCATPFSMIIAVQASATATFDPIGPLCVGDTPPALPTTSTNNITGTWNPATISTAAPGTITYTFTPDAGSCGTGTTLDVTVNSGATPTFTQLGPYCQGATPAALPGTSTNGISGSWNPATISTATPGNTVYTFTPNAGQCASAQTMTVTVNSNTTPTFTQLGPYCEGDTPAALPGTSMNGISGTWNPATISTAAPGSTVYTFTPNAGQCASAQTMTVNVTPGTTPTFAQLGPYCEGDTPAALPGTSMNGIDGTWNPATISTAAPGSTVYTFTPNAGQCASAQTMTVNVTPGTVPTFTQLGPYCQGETPAALSGTSMNGINGTWSPAGINTAMPGEQDYTFTPNPGQCASTQIMKVTVTATPVANTPVPLQFCVLFVPPTLLSENSTVVLNQITGGDPGLTVNWFFDAAATMPILDINSIFSIVPPPTTVYANVSNGACTSGTVPVGVTITQPPVLANPGPQSACQSYTLPAIIGFNLPGNQAYYTGTNGTGMQLLPGQTVTATTTLFIYAGSGLCFDQEQFTITITPPPTANPAGPLQLCDNGAGVGQFNLTSLNALISGGVGTVNWFTNAAVTNPIGNPAAFVSGSTTVYATVSAAPGCNSAPLPVVLQLLSAPMANPAGPLQVCDNGAGLGIFQLNNLNATISGGSGTVSWFTNAGATIPVPNPAGHISGSTTVYATVSNGVCTSAPVPVLLELLPTPVANTPADPFEVCVSAPPNAIFNLTNLNNLISGGTGTVNWFSNSTGTIAINNPGSYASSTGTVYAVVSNGTCSSLPVPVVLQANPVPVVNLALAQPISCNAAIDGAILTSISGAPGPYTFDWDFDSIDGIQNPTGLPAGTYSVVVTVIATNCAGTANIVLTEPAPLVLNCSQISPVSVPGSSDGIGGVAVSGGTAPYTVAWSGPQSGSQTQGGIGVSNIANLSAGTYSVTVTDANDCEQTCTFTIVAPGCGITLNIAGTNPSCDGGNDGAISLMVNNAGGNLTFNWNVDALDGIQNPTGLPAGTYAVIVTDGAGCSANTSVTLSNPVALALVCAQQNPVSTIGGNDGSATVQIGGGTAGYTVAWSGPVSGSQNQAAAGTATIAGLPAGTYSVTVTDANGCEQTCLFVIDAPGCGITLNIAGTNPSCDGGSDGAISLTVNNASGNLIFNWNVDTLDGIQNPTGLPEGPYTVVVTDALGCAATATVTLTAPSLIELICDQENPASAAGAADGSATVIVSGGAPGYLIEWSGPLSGSGTLPGADTLTISDLEAGDYTVLVTDANGCESSCTFTIDGPIVCNLTVDINSSGPICLGSTDGSITLTVNGAFGALNFDWNDNALDGIQNPVDLAPGAYTVIVTDAFGCADTASITLTESPEIVMICEQENPVSTPGGSDGSATVTISGGVPGYVLEWSNSQASGTVTVATPGTTTLTGLGGGNDYVVVVTDANGCNQICGFVIDAPFPCGIYLDVTTIEPPTCNGSANGRITVDVGGTAGELTVVWNVSALDGELKPTGLSGGTYSVTVTDENNCTVSTTIVLNEPDPIQLLCAQLNPTSSDTSADGSATVTISGGNPGYILIWDGPASGSLLAGQPGNYTIPNLPAGDYTLTVRDAGNCITMCQFTIEKPSCDIALLLSGADPSCNGAADGSISLNITGATGSIFFDWSDNAFDGIQNPTGVAAGAYSVTITDQEGCESTNSITLGQPSAIVLICAQETTLSRVGANDGSAMVVVSGGTPGYTVNWSGPLSGSATLPDADTLRIAGLEPGTYTVVVTDDQGCEATCIFVIEDILCELTLFVDEMHPVCFGDSTGSILLSIGNANGGLDFDWNDNALDGEQNPSGLPAGTYSVVVTDSLGCTISGAITLLSPNAIELVCAQVNPVSAPGADDGSATVQISGGTAGYAIAWSGPANGAQMMAGGGTANISNLPEGDYTVTVTDTNGCEETCTFTIGPPCAITADIAGTDPTCNGSTDGDINLTVNNGVGNLTFDWNVDALDGIQNPTGLPAGDYTVIVTDSLGCVATATVTLTEPSLIELICAEQDQVSTIGGNDGTATIQISGGTAGYTVAWSGPASGSQNEAAAGTATITGLVAGNYTVTVTDANGCEATCTFSIGTVGCNFSLDITALNPACNGEANGIIFVIINGGTPGFSFDWNVDALDGIQDPFDLPAGNYSVTATDGIGCQATASIMLQDPPVLTLACAQQNPASTIGGNDGSGAVTITGGVAVYNVNYTGPVSGDETADAEGTTILGNLSPGTYNIEVTDSNGCVETCSFNIGDPSCDLTIDITGTNPLCDGDTNGSISLTVTNGIGNVTFDWNVAALDGIQNPTGLAAGAYSVTVTDADGCSVNTSVTLTAPAAIALVCAQQNPVSTVGGADGTATIQISGGTAGYTVAWSGPASGTQNEAAAGTATITGLTAGDYTVTVTDANGCETTCTFTIAEPVCDITLNIAGTDPLCNGGSTGSISLAVNNSTGNLTFDWNDNSLDGIQNPGGLAAGTYAVVVTDEVGCTADATVTLSEPALLGIVCTQQSPVSTPGGDEGSAGVQISGGTAPYTVAWSGPLSGSQNQAAAGTAIIPDLSAGNYTIVVTDANGCEATCTLTFADPSCNLTLTITGTDPSCNGSLDGSIDLTVSGVNGNATFEWSNPALNGIQNPTGLPGGAYSVVVTDDAGCSATDAVVLVNPAALVLVCAQQNPVSTVGGNNGTATIQISGGTAGYTVAWSGAASGSQNQATAGTATISGLIAGDYTVLVTDANGCTSTCTFTIVEPICNLTLNITGANPLCNGDNTGSINLTVNGAIGTPAFDWNVAALDGIQNPTGLAAGAYSVTVTDGAGCTANASVTLTEPAALVLVCGQQSPASGPSAEDGSASIQISGGVVGTYAITIDGPISGAGNLPGMGNFTLPELEAGDYTITLTDANGCTTSCSFTIGLAGCNMALAITGTNPLCNGGNTGSINLAVTGAIGNLTFDWNDNSLDGIQNPAGLTAGAYSVTVTDGVGCTATASVTLVEPTALALVCAQQNPVSTIGGDDGSATVQISGGTAGYTVTWSGPASGSQSQAAAGTATIAGLIPGTYTIVVTDANGCTATCSFSIGSPNCNLALNIAGANPLCNGNSNGSISLAVNNSTGNLTFDWNENSLDGLQNPSGLAAGTYSVIVTDGAGCTANASVTLSDPAALAFTASGTGPDCFSADDGFITIESIAGGTLPYEVSTNGTFFTVVGALPLTRPGLTPGAYTVIVRDANGCTVQRNVNITAPQQYTLDLGPDLFVALGDSIRLEGLANFDIDSVIWTPQRFLSDPSGPATFVRPTETTGYRLRAFDINGCGAEDDIIVYVQRVLNVFIPNAFSPNDDGVNDVLMIFADDKITEVKSFRIFDRWGNMLFFNGPFPPNDPQYGWNGEFNGRPMNAGVYVYAAEVEYVDGRTELVKGEVMLMR